MIIDLFSLLKWGCLYAFIIFVVAVFLIAWLGEAIRNDFITGIIGLALFMVPLAVFYAVASAGGATVYKVMPNGDTLRFERKSAVPVDNFLGLEKILPALDLADVPGDMAELSKSFTELAQRREAGETDIVLLYAATDAPVAVEDVYYGGVVGPNIRPLIVQPGEMSVYHVPHKIAFGCNVRPHTDTRLRTRENRDKAYNVWVYKPGACS